MGKAELCVMPFVVRVLSSGLPMVGLDFLRLGEGGGEVDGSVADGGAMLELVLCLLLLWLVLWNRL